jgi:hypothetical protein
VSWPARGAERKDRFALHFWIAAMRTTELQMSVALSEAMSSLDGEVLRPRRARFGTACAMAGLVFAGVANVLWIAALGYVLSLLVL